MKAMRSRTPPPGPQPVSVSVSHPGPAEAAPGVTLVAIVGGSGSGKTWLARELKRRLHPEADILSLDDFYADLSHRTLAARAAENFDAPRAIDWSLFRRCLQAILDGDAVLLPQYDFATHTRSPHPRPWEPKRIVLVEGLWLWRRREIARLFALKVFRSGSEEMRFSRRLDRDRVERGRSHDSIRSQWHGQVEPMYRRFVLPQMRTADVTLPAHAPEADLVRLAERIRTTAKR